MSRDLEVRHCRALMAMDAGGGVGAAARALGVAQSTVSETLSSLERLLGVPVTVRRAGRETALTPAAVGLLPYARTLIATSEAGLAASVRESAVTIRLGSVESISSYLLPGPLRDFRATWPQVDVRITIGLCDDLRKRVAQGELDVALTIEGASDDDGNGVRSWPSQLRLIVAPDDPLAGQVVPAKELATRTLLLSDSDGAFNDMLRRWLAPLPPPRFESAGSIGGVKRGVLAGEAIGILPDYAVAEEIVAGTLVALRTDIALPAVFLRLTTRVPAGATAPLQALLDKVTAALG